MIDIHKNVIRYKIEHGLRLMTIYVTKYVNKATSMQMVRISLINEKLDSQNNASYIILFKVLLYFGKCLISTN